jgi:hypothetical protein
VVVNLLSTLHADIAGELGNYLANLARQLVDAIVDARQRNLRTCPIPNAGGSVASPIGGAGRYRYGRIVCFTRTG